MEYQTARRNPLPPPGRPPPNPNIRPKAHPGRRRTHSPPLALSRRQRGSFDGIILFRHHTRGFGLRRASSRSHLRVRIHERHPRRDPRKAVRSRPVAGRPRSSRRRGHRDPGYGGRGPYQASWHLRGSDHSVQGLGACAARNQGCGRNGPRKLVMKSCFTMDALNSMKGVEL